MRVGLNFVVPFLVASYGYLSASRVPRGSGTAVDEPESEPRLGTAGAAGAKAPAAQAKRYVE